MKSFVCITGATGGLGKAFAVECASRGWNLFLTDLSGKNLENLSRGLASTYDIEALYYPCDLANDGSQKDFFAYIQKEKLEFDILINVAGLDFEGFFTERTPQQIRTITRVNIEGNLEMTYAILKARDKEKPFRIINVSSLAAFYPMPIKAMYSASKRFLLNFSMALREELRPAGVTVTALCPAGMPTTEGCRQSIESQGFAGRLTTKNVGYVASKTIDHALKGHAVYIPGLLNRMLRFVGFMFPSGLLARAICERWKSTRKRKEAIL